MKKIFLAVAACSMLAACSEVKDSVELQTPQQPEAIQFGVYSARTTKAAIVDRAALEASGFDVVAAYGTTDETLSLYFAETTVGYVSDRYKSPYYWPMVMDGKTMEFYAANTNIAGDNAGTLTYGSNKATFAYTTPAASENQFDIVTSAASVTDAVPTSERLSGAKGCVDLTFGHALTKVNFSFVGADTDEKYTYTVSSITVTALSAGTCTVKPGVDPAWSSLMTEQTFSYDVTGHTDAKGTTATAPEANLMLIPQTGNATGELTCTIEYIVEYNGVLLGDFTGTKKKTFTIPTTVNSVAWAPNKSFLYNLTLPVSDLVPITFTARVTNWAADVSQNITIGA